MSVGGLPVTLAASPGFEPCVAYRQRHGRRPILEAWCEGARRFLEHAARPRRRTEVTHLVKVRVRVRIRVEGRGQD